MIDFVNKHNDRNPGKEVIYLNYAAVDPAFTNDKCSYWHFRWDAHSDYGSHVSPRVSALYRPGPWTIRATFGRGFYAPTPFVEETEANGLARLLPYAKLKAEIADSGSIDFGYASGPFEANLSLFASNIDHAQQLQMVDADHVTLVNADGVTRTRGAEVLNKVLDTDEGARRLGEVALVPHSSPISKSGVLFLNTLFDENASCHIALGQCYSKCFLDGASLSQEQIRAQGGNSSLIHIDWMIGSDKVDIDGIKPDGSRVPVMRQGEWA